MKKNILKITSVLLVLSLCLSAVSCKKNDVNGGKENGASTKTSENSENAISPEEAGMTMEENNPSSNDTFKPADYSLEPKDEFTYEFLGLKFKLPEKIKTEMADKNIAMLDDQSPIDKELKYAILTFSSINEEQKNAVVSKMGDEYDKWQESLERFGSIGMFEKGMAEEEISKITKCDSHKKIGESSDGKYEYYLSSKKDSNDFASEFNKTETEIIEKKERPENGFVLSEKSDLENTEAFGANQVEDISSVVTKDIDGKEFSSKDFEKYDLTMVNVFATWCTACIKEIPDLVKLQDEMKDKGVNIVGIVTDTVDDNGENKDALEKAKTIMEKTKANYKFLMPDKTNFNGRLNGIQALPETFFVDKNGKIVGETYSGSHDLKAWREIVEKELENLKK